MMTMTEKQRAHVLIVGIGNLLLSDEGVGIHAVSCLSQQELPPDIEVLDGGTSGADLVDYLAGRVKVIVIDAASGNGPPGTIYRCKASELIGQEGSLSLHEFGLADSLHMAEQLGCAPQAVIVLGVQPATLEPGMELSPEIAAVLPHIINLALAEATVACAKVMR
jgi:hydrogenase maturation protease